MTWRGALRALGAELRRQERQARRQAREAERAYQAAAKADAQERARLEVLAFERRLEALTTMHCESADTIPWKVLAEEAGPEAPAAPQPISRIDSQAAAAALAEYTPGFFARTFGLSGERRRLEAAVEEAIAAEDTQYAAAQRAHATALRAWEEAAAHWQDRRELAERVLAGDVEAYREVIQSLDSLEELGSTVPAQQIRVGSKPRRITVSLCAMEDDVVPKESKSLTARGAVALKKIPAARRLEIYEDYVCGTALRVAREMLAAVPVDDVLVHIDTNMLNSGTGLMEQKTILSVLCPRGAIEAIRWSHADASDVVARLSHRMKLLGRGKGFAAVERLTAGD